MTWKTWLLLVLALVAGSAASYAVKTAFFVEREEQASDESTLSGPRERLLVANGFISAGTELTASNVRLELTPEKDVPRDGIFSFADFSGRKTTRDFKDGEAISLYDVEAMEETEAEDSSFVPPGYSIVPIEIGAASKVNGSRNYLKTTKLDKIISVDDQVDILVVKENHSPQLGSAGAQRRRLTSSTIVEGATVFAIDDTNRFGTDGPERTSILSVLLKSEELELVRKASEEGKIRVVLNNEENLLNDLNVNSADTRVNLDRDDGSRTDGLVASDPINEALPAVNNDFIMDPDLLPNMNADFRIDGLDEPSEQPRAVVNNELELDQAGVVPASAHKNSVPLDENIGTVSDYENWEYEQNTSDLEVTDDVNGFVPFSENEKEADDEGELLLSPESDRILSGLDVSEESELSSSFELQVPQPTVQKRNPNESFRLQRPSDSALNYTSENGKLTLRPTDPKEADAKEDTTSVSVGVVKIHPAKKSPFVTKETTTPRRPRD